MQAHEIIGLDVGAKHTGVARASSMALLAEPLSTLSTDKALEELKKVNNQTKIQAIVVGLPRNLEGDDTKQTQWVREWVANAKKVLSLPFYWQDEALTSHQAAQNQFKTGDEHSQAAAIILQDFLDTPEEERVVC